MNYIPYKVQFEHPRNSPTDTVTWCETIYIPEDQDIAIGSIIERIGTDNCLRPWIVVEVYPLMALPTSHFNKYPHSFITEENNIKVGR